VKPTGGLSFDFDGNCDTIEEAAAFSKSRLHYIPSGKRYPRLIKHIL
jgi:hypothetical protein